MLYIDNLFRQLCLSNWTRELGLLKSLIFPSAVLLLLPGVLQTASNQTGQAEVPEQCGLQSGGLSGDGEQQEVYRLQVPEVHPHRHGPGTGTGESQRQREAIFRLRE